jgi:hypothetical protein
MKILRFSSVLFLLIAGCAHEQTVQQAAEGKPLTVIVIGDGGEQGPALRGNAKYVSDMYTEQHDAGKPDAMIFLGDNFYPTGLNIPSGDVQSKIRKILGPYSETLEALGPSNVHAIAGNHDYYARNIVETSVFFGLINIEAGPTGISDRGNEREKNIPWWTYHYKMPAEAVYPVSTGSKDSVQFIFYDSALPLRVDVAAWRPALDSLRSLLKVSSHRPGIVWRILCQHHPWYSLGEHGGYSVWDDEANAVVHLSNCDRDSNAVGWLKNSFDPEDLCAVKYQAQLDSLRSVVHGGGVKLQLVVAGHEHGLELLSYPESRDACEECPKTFVISGSGSKTAVTKLPSPPREFTASQAAHQGESRTGFAQLRFENDRFRVVFYSSSNGDMIDMGGGKKEFWIDRNGELLP